LAYSSAFLLFDLDGGRLAAAPQAGRKREKAIGISVHDNGIQKQLNARETRAKLAANLSPTAHWRTSYRCTASIGKQKAP